MDNPDKANGTRASLTKESETGPKEKTTMGVLTWSPTVVLVRQLAAYPRERGWDPEYSYESGTLVQRVAKLETCELGKWDIIWEWGASHSSSRGAGPNKH